MKNLSPIRAAVPRLQTLMFVEGLVADRVGEGFDEVTSFGGSLAHVGAHASGGIGQL